LLRCTLRHPRIGSDDAISDDGMTLQNEALPRVAGTPLPLMTTVAPLSLLSNTVMVSF